MVDETGIRLPEIPDIDRPNTESFDHPLILWVSITVFIRPQCMRHTLKRVDHWAREVVCRVYLPFRTEVTQTSTK